MKKLLFLLMILALAGCYKNQESCWDCQHRQITPGDTLYYVTQPCDLTHDEIVVYEKYNTYQMLYNDKVVYDLRVHCMKLTCPE